MMLPLMHHGMLMVGIPYSEAALMNTQLGNALWCPVTWLANWGQSCKMTKSIVARWANVFDRHYYGTGSLK